MNDERTEGYVEAQRDHAKLLRALADDYDPDFNASDIRAQIWADLTTIRVLAASIRDTTGGVNKKSRNEADEIYAIANKAAERMRML